jgi:hypothetical protein
MGGGDRTSSVLQGGRWRGKLEGDFRGSSAKMDTAGEFGKLAEVRPSSPPPASRVPGLSQRLGEGEPSGLSGKSTTRIRPSLRDLGKGRGRFPAMNRWAIISRPSGTKPGEDLPDRPLRKAARTVRRIRQQYQRWVRSPLYRPDGEGRTLARAGPGYRDGVTLGSLLHAEKPASFTARVMYV